MAMPATTSNATPDASKRGNIRATRYTPAATMVAAWMRALTGVGPSMASGSHTWKGNWADFPIAPVKRRRAAAVTTAGERRPASTWAKTSWIWKVPVCRKRRRIPMSIPTSPRRVVMKAFLAASAAGAPLVPEPDEEIGAQPHQLPGDVQQEEVVRQHQGEHGGGEEGVGGKIPPEAGLAGHVPPRVHLHQQGHKGHQAHQHQGEGVKEHPPGDPHIPRLEPGEGEGVTPPSRLYPAEEDPPEHPEPAGYGQGGQPRPLPGQDPPEEDDGQEGRGAQGRGQPRPLHGLTTSAG
jgi:hypothetical protein